MMTTDPVASADAIRETRERFNQAIAGRDAAAIQAFFAPSYHIVTGRSAQNHGSKEEGQRWEEVFQQDPTAIYRRTPREFHINEEWGIAQEIGNWKGGYTAEGKHIYASGVYAAKWQKAENGEWVLQVEVFTTLECSGPESGCVRPDPIHR